MRGIRTTLLFLVIATLMVACAHQGAETKDEMAAEVSSSEEQLRTMVDATEESEIVAEEAAPTGVVASAETIAPEQKGSEQNSADATTDDLVAKIEPEPATSVVETLVQGQAEILPGEVAQTEPLVAGGVLVAAAPKTKIEKNEVPKVPARKVIEKGEVPKVPAAVPASEERTPGSMTFPEKATVVPTDKEATEELEAVPILEPNDDQLKSEMDREKVLASAEVGGIVTRPWFAWFAIAGGILGFLILALARWRRKTTSE